MDRNYMLNNPYVFKVKHNHCWSEYSGRFKTKKDAAKWYVHHGMYLVDLFDRKLKLFKSYGRKQKPGKVKLDI